MDYQANAREYVLHALRRDRSVIFARAEGSRLWDIHGKVYLDTMSGSAGPAMVGHANPQVAAAVAKQMATLPSVNIVHDSVPVIEFCTGLPGLRQRIVEDVSVRWWRRGSRSCHQIAMRISGRTEVLSLTGAYHGQSFATMGLGGMSTSGNVDAIGSSLAELSSNPIGRHLPATPG